MFADLIAVLGSRSGFYRPRHRLMMVFQAESPVVNDFSIQLNLSLSMEFSLVIRRGIIPPDAHHVQIVDLSG